MGIKSEGLDSNYVVPQEKIHNSEEEDEDVTELDLTVRMIEVEPDNSNIVYVMGDVDTQVDGFSSVEQEDLCLNLLTEVSNLNSSVILQT